tara:strand:- start:70 stop:483 length:414 start_codon:yes stop_codon:yes gene_type:complete
MDKAPTKIKNKKLYLKIKKDIYKRIPKHSAYRSALILKEYKKKGGKIDEKLEKKGNLNRWFREEWTNLTPFAEGLTKDKLKYPCGKKAPKQKGKSVCRPSKKINKNTPKLAQSYSKEQIQKAIKIKNLGKVINWEKL